VVIVRLKRLGETEMGGGSTSAQVYSAEKPYKGGLQEES
jgi:hypothetical protein